VVQSVHIHTTKGAVDRNVDSSPQYPLRHADNGRGIQATITLSRINTHAVALLDSSRGKALR
jgi:hypothetical protein